MGLRHHRFRHRRLRFAAGHLVAGARGLAASIRSWHLRNVELQRREGVLGWSRFGLGILFIVVGLALTFFSPPGVGLMIHFTYSIMVQFGMVLLLPKLVVWGSRILRPLMGRLFGAEGLIALDAAVRMPRRTSATVGALMLGLSFVFSVGAFITVTRPRLIACLIAALTLI